MKIKMERSDTDRSLFILKEEDENGEHLSIINKLVIVIDTTAFVPKAFVYTPNKNYSFTVTNLECLGENIVDLPKKLSKELKNEN